MRKIPNFQNKLQYLIGILCTLYSCYLFGSQNIREIIATIPTNDQVPLEKLFRILFNNANFSYTLFGDKPMSLEVYSTALFDEEDIFSQTELRFRKRWETWKKYAYLFPIKQYLLIENPSDRKDIIDIYFINKNSFINKVNEHLSLFQQAFGEDITGSFLLEKIEKDPKILSTFDAHQTLLGILLGYGKHNACLFAERHQLSPFVYKKEFPKIPVKIPAPSKGFSSLEEEFNSYFSVLTLFGDPGYSPLIIRSVHFVADHKHPETIALQEKYRRLRGEISAIYAKGDFLEITLSKLTED
jgi:hypothetical protein